MANEIRPKPIDIAQRHLQARIVVAGVTDVATSWINGAVSANREALIAAIITLAQAID